MLPQQVSDLVRIFILSLILSIGYGMNFASITKALITGEQQLCIWCITYAVATFWLFILCLGTISVTLFGFMNKLLYSHNSITVGLFTLGAFVNVISLIFMIWTDQNNRYVCWELESLYTLLPLYLACLIYFFNDERLTQIRNLTIFSFILFITPFIRLLIILEFLQFPLLKPMPFMLVSSYVSVCFGAAILTSIHIGFLTQHYNSGLFIKLCISCSLLYYIITILRNKIDFDKYNDKYRIYYYYILITLLCIIYIWHIFMKGRKRVVQVDMEHIQSSPSFDINVETMDMNDMFDAASKPAVTSILDIAISSRSTVPSTMSPSGASPSKSSLSNNIFGACAEVYITNPNETIDSIIKAFPDFKPCAKNREKYFDEIKIDSVVSEKAADDSKLSKHKPIDRVSDSICAIVPFYNEKASEIHATLRSLYFNFDYIKKKNSKYKFTHFNVLLVGDGWFKADISTQRYLAKLYSGCKMFKGPGDSIDDTFDSFTNEKHKHNTIILQTRHNRKLCINPFQNDEKRRFLKVTTVIKIDNRKKANSHEWFLGRYGFAEWCKCDYMFFTDAYSTLNKEGLYQMMCHMKEPKNSDVVCCTGRARVYSIDQELYYQNLLRTVHRDLEEKDDSSKDKNKRRHNFKYKHRKDSDQLLEHMAYERQNKKKQKSVPYIDAEKESLIGLKLNDYASENKYDSDININDAYEWWENNLFKNESDMKSNNKLFDDSGGGDIEDNRHSGENIFYSIQDIEFDRRLTINAHLRSCQTFEFEALYGTIGCYLLGGFLPVIPGPCGFYRSSILLQDEVRGWYFEKINQTNDPDNIDLVLGNMKLAEDRILTISSILNSSQPVRHSLIPECIFYFDPIPNITQLMKQRRRWLNGSIATVIFVLRKISFSSKDWKANFFRRYYVLSLWYMQLLMYIVVAISPPLIFIIAFEYGLATILDAVLIDHGNKDNQIRTVVTIFMMLSWVMFIVFIFFMQTDDRKKKQKKYKYSILNYMSTCIPKKSTIVTLTLTLSYLYGSLTLIGTFMQIINVLRPEKKIVNPDSNIVTSSFNFAVIIIEITFFVQSFVLAPMVSKDPKTLILLLKTCVHYFMYSPFYVTYFFINALANLHDLSWGTRPDNELQADDNGGNNPKSTTISVLFIVLFVDCIIAFTIQPFTEYVYAHIIFFSVLAFPSLYQIFFTLVWLAQTRLVGLWKMCKPKKMKDKIQYTGLITSVSLHD